MITYKRIKTVNTYRYTRLGENGKSQFVAADRVPQEILDKFELDEALTSLKYDDEPSKERCLFCEAPASYQRKVNLVTVDICQHHYYSMSLGRIAQQLRTNKEKINETNSSKSGSKKRQPAAA